MDLPLPTYPVGFQLKSIAVLTALKVIIGMPGLVPPAADMATDQADPEVSRAVANGAMGGMGASSGLAAVAAHWARRVAPFLQGKGRTAECPILQSDSYANQRGLPRGATNCEPCSSHATIYTFISRPHPPATSALPEGTRNGTGGCTR